MKILLLSSSDYKGAGVIAYTLNQELRERGHESQLIVQNDYSRGHEGVIGLYSQSELKFKQVKQKLKDKIAANGPKSLVNAVRKRKPQVESDYCPQSINERTNSISSDDLIDKFPFKPDAIVLFFINGFLNAENIKDIYQSTGAKILWFMPDMAAMTGGCHYAWDCDGYKNLCGRCPAILSDDPNDVTHQNMLYKQEQFKDVDLTMLTLSEWIDRQVQESTLFKKSRTERIQLPIDDNLFKPGDALDARRFFDIPTDKKIIFFGAQNLSARRKGLHLLVKALKIVSEDLENNPLKDKIHLLIAGSHIEELSTELNFEYSFKGLLSLDRELPKAYQAADVFVCPSIEDTGPTMINQSIMSGTPVVAFEMGVALDLVKSGETGYRAIWSDERDLAEGIKRIISLLPDELNQMRSNCRELGLSLGTVLKQAEVIECIVSYV